MTFSIVLPDVSVALAAVFASLVVIPAGNLRFALACNYPTDAPTNATFRTA